MSQGTANWNRATDAYWAGKNYGKAAELAAIARSHGMVNEANQVISWLKGELEDWFRANNTGALDKSKYFVYDKRWSTLLGFDESFGSQQQLNDHHFHYGYFVRAAAEICRVDASWCGANAWGPMVELLIRDYAADRNDPQFPYVRNFDPAYGFSWASGHANFALGNNNESTSEAANAYGAIVLYGMITNNKALTDRGVYLHASSTAAYWEYWNNKDRFLQGIGGDNDNFAPDYPRMTTSIIWGNGHVFSTWFSGAYAHILGIQGLPLSPLVFHVGQYGDYLRDYVKLGLTESSNGKPSGLAPGQWTDVWWNMQAMTDGEAAVNDYLSLNGNYTPEDGETKAHTYHWIYTLKQLGQLTTGTGQLTADSPAAVTFTKNGVKTYIAYPFGGAPGFVTFSDGMALNVPANGFRIKRSGERPDVRGSSSASSTPSAVTSSAVSVPNVSSAVTSSTASSVATNGDYGVTPVTGGLLFYVNNAQWADLHYTINGGAQQNLRISPLGNNTHRLTLNNVPAGATVNYFFTYARLSLGAVDTPWQSVKCCSASSAPRSSSPTSATASSANTSSVASAIGNPVAVIPNGRYIIKSVHSNLCVDVFAASLMNGGNIQQYSCNGTGAQEFEFTYLNNGSYRIANANSGKVLDVQDASQTNSAKVQQWDNFNANNQQFVVSLVGAGRVEIRAKHSNKCLDVAEFSTVNGGKIQQWDCSPSQTNQTWIVEKITPPAPPVNSPSMNVMSYNVRVLYVDDSNPEPEVHWDNRKAEMARMIQFNSPAVVGLQEHAGNDGYEAVRQQLGGSWAVTNSFHHSILYRSDWVQLLGTRVVTLFVGDQWGDRFVEIARFKRIIDGKEFVVANTHYATANANNAQILSTEKIAQELAADTQNWRLPVILVGDFNAPQSSQPLQLFGSKSPLKIISPANGPAAGWPVSGAAGGGLDHALANGFVVNNCKIDTYKEGRLSPSDHYPVVCNLNFR